MVNKIFILSISFLIINTVSFPQGGGLIIGNNYRIFPSTTSQSEVFIVNYPIDNNINFEQTTGYD